MQLKDELHSDHEAPFASLKKKDSAGLYTLPAGYFDQFPEQILNLIRVEVAGAAPSGLPKAKSLPFSLPEDYFDKFSTGLFIKIKELRDEESLNAAPREIPYKIPDQYFEQFPSLLLKAIQPATDPESEIRELSPLLAELREKKSYQVPNGYFQKPQKTIPFSNAASRSIRWARWTAAASVLLIFSLGAFQFFKAPSHALTEEQSIEAALAKIPDAAIQHYLEQSVNDFELNSLTQSFAVNESSATPPDPLKGVTDQEIRAYLEGNEHSK